MTDVPRLDLLSTYRVWFSGPDWMGTLGWAALTFLIPIVGPIAVLGYECTAIASLIRSPQAPPPKYDINRLVEYLTRGLYGFVMQMVASLVLAPVIVVVATLPALVIPFMGRGGDDAALIIGVVLLVISVLFLFAAVAVMIAVMTPMVLAAGLTQDFNRGFDFGFVREFVGNTWWPMVVGSLFLGMTSIPLVLLGYLACFVGAFPAIALITLAQGHLRYQLYQIHVARGGRPLAVALEN